MATNGTAYTNTYKSSRFYCSWTRTDYSSADNYSDISWSAGLYISGSDEWYTNAVRINSVVINGTTVMGSTTVSNKYGPGTFEMGSGTTRIYHNTDGTKSFTISIDGWLYSNHDLDGSESFTLDTIPRYATGATVTITAKTPTTLDIKLSANENCKAFEYKVDNGNWVNIPISSNRKTATATITGLDPGTSYTIYGDFKRADSNLWLQTKAKTTVTTTGVGKITSAPNFNDEENPTISYTNEYGDNVTSLMACISYNGMANVPYRDINKTGTSYTFNLTNEERDILRNAMTGNTMEVTFYVRTSLNGTYYYSTSKKTLRLINANPTFSDFDYEDINEITTDLTGNGKIIIDGYNDIQISIPVNSKAIANKGATMVKYTVACGNLTDEQPYSDNSEVVLNLKNITNRTITVYAVDSRNNTTETSIIISDWKSYTNIAFTSGSIARTGGASEESILTFEGTIWSTEEQYDFGDKANIITLCEYQYKKTNEDEEDYSQPISIIPTVSDTKFTYNLAIQGDEGGNGFNVANSYNIKIRVKDRLSEATYNVLLGVGLPLIAIAPTGVSIGKGYDEEAGGVFQYPGSIIVTGQEIKTSQIVDGNIVYFKRIDCGALPNNTSKSIASGLVPLNINLQEIRGFAKASNGVQIPLPHASPGAQNSVSAVMSVDGNIVIQTGIDRTNYIESHVDLYYTKIE